MSFDLFLKFPTEIHSLILAACLPNDEICLRLATKYLYNLPPSSPRRQINHDSKPISPLPPARLDNEDGINTCKHPASPDHLWECHALLKLEHDRQRAITNGKDLEKVKMMPIIPQKKRKNFNPCFETSRQPSPGIRGCDTRQVRTNSHCHCFDFPLYKRLNPWIKNTRGGNCLRYCQECNLFTKRNKKQQYRCSHGRRRRPKERGEYLTLRTIRDGRWQRKTFARRGLEWKKGFNTLAMLKMNCRLRDGQEKRKGEERYDMRKIKPVEVNLW